MDIVRWIQSGNVQIMKVVWDEYELHMDKVH
jgi:hypothetical protein